MSYTALIDADSLIYKVGFSIEDKTVWNEYEVQYEDAEPDVEYITDLEQCYATCDALVENIMFAAEAEECLLVFTGKGNFRYDNPLGYKQHRVGARKPTAYTEILNYLMTKYPSKMCEGYEADDYVVWLKMQKPDDYMVCAIDKDVIYQTPGLHYNYSTEDYISVSERKAKLFEYYQCLVGDTSDGYKGCPGIGPVKAKDILRECQDEQEMWSAVVDTYEKKGLTKEDAINTMRLCSMHQFNGEEVVLWEEI